MLVRHGSLAANTMSTVVLTRTSPSTVTPANESTRHYVNNSFKTIEVVNRGTGSIFFNLVRFIAGVASPTPAAPVVSGDDTWVVHTGERVVIPVESQLITNSAGVRTYEVRVRLIAGAAGTYSLVAS